MKQFKRTIKRIWKRLTCKHDYWWYGEVTWSNSHGYLDHERKETICKCRLCHKEKSIIYKKPLDK